MSEALKPVAFHMMKADDLMRLIATEQIARRVVSRGSMNMVEITTWKTSLGLTLTCENDLSGTSVFVTPVPEDIVLVPREVLERLLSDGYSMSLVKELRAILAQQVKP